MLKLHDQPVLIHFKNGAVQKGLLQSSLLSARSIRYTPKSPLDDRRQTPRVPFIKEVKVDRMGIRRAADLSAGGIYVETLVMHPPGAVLPLSFNLDRETVSLKAKVAFTEPGIGMGLEFCHVPAAVRCKLEALIQQISRDAGDARPPRRGEGDRRARQLRLVKGARPTPREKRRRERRSARRAPSPAPVEVKLSQVKAVFFLKGGVPPASPKGGFQQKGNAVLIEFRDGEQIMGTIQDFSPETPGFFVDLPVKHRLSYTAYIIKSAVKQFSYLF